MARGGELAALPGARAWPGACGPQLESSAMADLLIHDLAEVATPNGTSPRRGADQRRVSRPPGAEVPCRDGRIAFAGAPEGRPRLFRELPAAEPPDGRGGTRRP